MLTNALKELIMIKNINSLTKNITANFAKSKYTALTEICQDARIQRQTLDILIGPGCTK